MKKALLTGFFMALMATVPLGASAGQTIDSPHVNLDGNANTEDCSLCHFSAGAYTCTDCHANATGGYSDTSAPLATTHLTFNCQACHNPHVSLQYGKGQPALVTGSISNVTPAGNQITFGISGVSGPWAADPSVWAAKTSAGRGLILWLTQGSDAYSFEIDSATASSITVKGSLPTGVTITTPKAFELQYGQLVAKKIGATVPASTTSYREGVHDVTFPLGGSNDFANASGQNGVCQVCHTTTNYWRNDGTRNTHNPTQACTDCHDHKNTETVASGFLIPRANCPACHVGYPEPPASAKHDIHASSSTGYGFECNVCHKGGMTAGLPATSDNQVQIGFNLIPVNPSAGFSGANTSYNGMTGTFGDAAGYGQTYQGANGTSVSASGAMTCSNVYCHSNGYAATVPADAGGPTYSATVGRNLRCTTSTANVSPKWDGTSPDPQGDTNKCNNCHNNVNYPGRGVDLSYGTTITYAAAASLPGFNTHWKHVRSSTAGGPDNLKCQNCHNLTATTDDTLVVNNKQYHANGAVDVKSGGLRGGKLVKFTYNPTTYTCSFSSGDPNAASCHATRQWKNLNNNANTTDNVACQTVTATANILPTMKWTAYARDNQTLTLTDNSYDLDYVDPVKAAAYGGHNGSPGLIQFNWHNEMVTWETKAMIDEPTSKSLTHIFNPATLQGSNGEAWIEYFVYDNNGPGVVSSSYSGWFGSKMSDVLAPDHATINSVARITQYQVSNTPGSTLVTINIWAYDSDYQDATKRARYGEGFDGSQGLVAVNWQNYGVTYALAPLTDVPQLIATSSYDFAGKAAAGNTVWITFNVGDNYMWSHYQRTGVELTSENSAQGWFGYTLQ